MSGQPKEGMMNQAEKILARIQTILARYDPGQPRDRTGRWTGGGATASATSDRSLRAAKSYVPATAAKQRFAEAQEAKVAAAIGGKQQGDNTAFDVRGPGFAAEVQSVLAEIAGRAIFADLERALRAARGAVRITDGVEEE